MHPTSVHELAEHEIVERIFFLLISIDSVFERFYQQLFQQNRFTSDCPNLWMYNSIPFDRLSSFTKPRARAWREHRHVITSTI